MPAGPPGAAVAAAPLPRPLEELVRGTVERWRATHEREWRTEPAVAELARATADGGLRVAYQPILALEDRRPVATEALLRLDRPRHPALADTSGLVHVAETCGLIGAIGTGVLVRACTQLATWRRDPAVADLQVHVNLSPHQLREPHLLEVVERTLSITGLAPPSLVLEITETAAFDTDGVAASMLTSLAALGVEIAIDDFGTGFASLELLASTPATSMKLDRTFVASVGDVTEPPRGRALMVQAAIGLGHTLGLRVVAEGIESEVQARTLAAWGCALGQGYLFARACRPEELTLRRSPSARPGAPGRRPGDHGTSEETTHLALAAASVLAATGTAHAELRSDAMAVAVVLAEALACHRWEADTTAVLASFVDPPERLAELLPPATATPAVTELVDALARAPAATRTAERAELAAAARALAGGRRRGRPLGALLGELALPLDPVVLERVGDWWYDAAPSPPAASVLLALERRLGHRDDAARRLHSLTALTHAIGRGGTLTDVLAVTAEEARAALGAASLSIARLEREEGRLRVLVNVGDLAAWERPRPHDEVYDLSDHPVAAARLLDRAVHIELASDGVGPRAADTQLLTSLGKGSSLAAPIVVGGVAWGEVYATTAVGDPPFTMADAPFGTAIANVIALAVQGAEEVEQLGRLATEDPLTHLANRRQLEHRLSELLEPGDHGAEVGVLMLDVDGLKDVNDEFGHAEGDAMLVRVADVLSRVALTVPGGLAARLAGDEFCIVVPDGCHDVQPLVDRIRTRLAGGPPPQPRLSAGYAVMRAGAGDTSELLRRADAAQYRAKRTGVPVVAIAADEDLSPPAAQSPAPEPRRRRSSESADPGRATHAALARWRELLDTPALVPRLDALGDVAVALLDCNRWLLSEVPASTETLHIRRINVRRRTPGLTPFPRLEDQVYRLDQFPRTAEALRTGEGFAVDVDDAGADPAERALLAELGNRYVVLLVAREGGSDWLLEFYGDERSAPLEDAVPLVEALASRTLGRRVRCQPDLPER